MVRSKFFSKHNLTTDHELTDNALVGGKFDNGGRFDLRLPYADQGYVSEDADVMGKFASFFGGKKKKEEPKEEEQPPEKKKGWPW